MDILLTRPLEDSFEIISKFQNLGHKVLHMPLLKINKKEEHEEIDYSNIKGIIFTSANSIKFLNHNLIPKTIFCFCVGSATEKVAKSVGFQKIYSAEGNVENLKEIILQNFNKTDGRLIYFSGEFISKNLDKELISQGYLVKRIINYKSIAVDFIQNDVLKILKNKAPDVVFVYSEKSAVNFVNLINKYDLIDLFINSNLMCISEKVSSVLNQIKWKKIYIFNPGEEEFLLYKI